MDLFNYNKDNSSQPLAARFRPTTLDDFIGQTHIVGQNSLLRRAIMADKLSSMIFYGPPGTGKTTLAEVIANTTDSEFIKLNAVTSGVKDIREVIKAASDNLDMYGTKTILFIDEIHRFNKSQQDALLPSVEKGTIILIGATTENPYFEVNSALISRATIFKLHHLTKEELFKLLYRVLNDGEKGYKDMNISITDDAKNHLVQAAGGDARVLLNGLELAVLTTPTESDGSLNITLQEIEQSVQKNGVIYDKDGDNHYDIISAMIKSIRGSDPDGAVYWLARLIEGGEDPKYIARRLVVHASEDIGNADPNALNLAVSTFHAINFVGMPEGRIILSQCCIYLATAPKSNKSYVAIDEALEDVVNNKTAVVPAHLKDSHYKGAAQLGHGLGYKYPHSYPKNFITQQYLPDELKNKRYYTPEGNGYERKIREYIDKTKGSWEN
ncbi:replication-associated recombination protein A [Proteinivorax hydrogeniformans]|uniref:Replication-associated recombination protein A n=1 Tax=Proteinivorax hydrogeniformans TaxID=1826727 RepID=A0AAU8HSB2_9FIRM